MLGKRFIAVVMLIALAGCQSSDETPSVSATVPVAYTVTARSAGPITSDTPYSSAAIGRLFPEARLDTVTTADENGVVAAITVFEDGLQLFQVLPAADGKTIRSVHGSGLAVAGPNGERLGTSFAQAGVSRSDCTVGTGPWAGMAVCTARGAPNVRLVFDNGGWDGPESELAPQKYLAGSQLQRLVWLPRPTS